MSNMNRLVLISLMIGLICPVIQGAQRTVMYEHFTEDLCSYCPEVAAAIAAFRNDYTYQQVAIISYSVRGSDAVPEGEDRMGYFSKEFCPAIIGDGEADFESLMPCSESDLITHYNTRKNVPSVMTMEVIKDSNTSYRIILHAESAFTGKLMAVAYEDITHDSVHYPCFARQILTDVYGDSISMASDETREITKTVSLEGSWNPANMGVVAWIGESGKDERAFRAHPSYQAADSKAPHTNPTPTPPNPDTPTPTPPSYTPPPEGTPTPTPTFSASDLQQEIVLSQTMFNPGDIFDLKIHTQNPGASSVNVDQYFALQVSDMFFFWNSWTTAIDYEARTYAAGYQGDEQIFQFQWPSGAGSYNGLVFWLVSLKSGTSQLAGQYDFVTFGYQE